MISTTWRSIMKKLITGVVLATLIAGSAFAQSYNPGDYNDNVIFPSSARIADTQAAPVTTAAPSKAVVFDGKVIGQDPDANVRLQMRKDAGEGVY
jgi:hypothetical protein